MNPEHPGSRVRGISLIWMTLLVPYDLGAEHGTQACHSFQPSSAAGVGGGESGPAEQAAFELGKASARAFPRGILNSFLSTPWALALESHMQRPPPLQREWGKRIGGQRLPREDRLSEELENPTASGQDGAAGCGNLAGATHSLARLLFENEHLLFFFKFSLKTGICVHCRTFGKQKSTDEQKKK